MVAVRYLQFADGYFSPLSFTESCDNSPDKIWSTRPVIFPSMSEDSFLVVTPGSGCLGVVVRPFFKLQSGRQGRRTLPAALVKQSVNLVSHPPNLDQAAEGHLLSDY